MKYAAFTKNAPDKPRNGECFHILEYISGAKIVMLAAGCENAPCDWRAAELAVKTLTELFENETIITAEIIQQAVINAGIAVEEIFGICAGAKTALAMALIQTNGSGWLVNIGPTLAMKWSDDRLEELVTGQSIELLGDKLKAVKTIPVQLEKNNGLVFISGGVEKHPLRNYLKDFSYLFSKPDPDKNLPRLMAQYLTGQERDMTAIVLQV